MAALGGAVADAVLRIEALAVFVLVVAVDVSVAATGARALFGGMFFEAVAGKHE